LDLNITNSYFIYRNKKQCELRVVGEFYFLMCSV
jgi:hypothetical protein